MKSDGVKERRRTEFLIWNPELQRKSLIHRNHNNDGGCPVRGTPIVISRRWPVLGGVQLVSFHTSRVALTPEALVLPPLSQILFPSTAAA